MFLKILKKCHLCTDTTIAVRLILKYRSPQRLTNNKAKKHQKGNNLNKRVRLLSSLVAKLKTKKGNNFYEICVGWRIQSCCCQRVGLEKFECNYNNLFIISIRSWTDSVNFALLPSPSPAPSKIVVGFLKYCKRD